MGRNGSSCSIAEGVWRTQSLVALHSKGALCREAVSFAHARRDSLHLFEIGQFLRGPVDTNIGKGFKNRLIGNFTRLMRPGRKPAKKQHLSLLVGGLVFNFVLEKKHNIPSS